MKKDNSGDKPVKRNKFSLSHFRLMSCSMGQLVPLTWFEVLPGDTIQQSTSVLLRCSPLVTPPLHPVHVRVHHFYVPYRIIWQGTNPTGSSATGGFENFITGGANGLDATVHPYIAYTNWHAVNSLDDYLGLPATGAAIPGGGTINLNALPFRAYQLIWNEYYRDQDLQTAAVVSTADGADTTTAVTIQNVDWQKDYYTTARPWEQKGPAVNIFAAGATATIRLATGATPTTTVTYPGVPAQSANTQSTPPTQAYNASTDAAVAGTQWFTDLGGGQAGTDINALRHQFAIQRFQELRARYGSRYVEYLRALGIRSSDSRLQRPEYLSGGTATIQFSEVLQTGVTTSGTQSGVGQMFGHGISGHRTNRYRRFFEEHGLIMSLLSVRPITVYTNPVARKWLRGMTGAGGAIAPTGMAGTKEDYFMRELQHIGQQIVNPAEVDGSQNGVGTALFGYQDRYDEYRRIESQVSGQFRSNLNTWHFARAFASSPALNSTFVSCVPSLLPFADQAHDTLYLMCNHSIQARRMMTREGGSFVR